MFKHWGVEAMRRQLAAGTVDRREFLRTLTLLGVSLPAALTLVARTASAQQTEQQAQVEATPAAVVPPDAPRRGGTLRCLMRVIESQDPATFGWADMGNLVRHVLEPLTRVGADNITRPWLAERWEASGDLTRWTFYLRQGIRWSNGLPFTAADVAYTVQRWMDPALGSSNLARFSALRGGAVEMIDPYTIRFVLRAPFLAFPESLADYPALIVPQGFAGDFITNPIGTGPFRLAEFVAGDRALLVRRPDAEIWGTPPYLDEILYLDYGSDDAAMLAALTNNQVDLLFNLNPEQVDAARQLPGILLYETMSAATAVARMRVTEPPFNDLRVRQAVRLSIDHQGLLNEAHRGLGLPGEDHHVSPLHPEYAELPPPQRDVAAARRLLAEAGYAAGLPLAITCRNTPVWEARVCDAMVGQLAEAGITLTVRRVTAQAYDDLWTSVPFGLTFWSHRPLGVQVLSLGYRSGAAWNETGFSDPEFDVLLDQAEGLLDVAQRRAVMAQLQTRLQQASVIVQPFWLARHVAARSRVRGFRANPSNEHHFERVWLAE